MPKPPFDLTGRVAIVTGGGTGIGRAIALVFARYGADLVLASRKLHNLEKVAGEVRTLGRRALPVATDVTEVEDVEAMVKTAMAEYGRIDILVNNAGASFGAPLDQMSVERWKQAIDLNLLGPFLCSQGIGKIMIQQGGGVIVNISSRAGTTGARGVAGYGAAKAGLQQLTRLMAAEWGRHHIRVNCIAVGAIKSEGYILSMTRAGRDPDKQGSRNAIGRLGIPEEIAYPVLFLASDASSYMSGDTIAVDGGPFLP